ncbi:MAG: SpoIVB peptidase S55 domain-containing protein [Myxococcota bacterium]
MASRRALWVLAAGLGLAAGVAAPAGAKKTKTMPVSEVKVGMKGYAVTVFKGQQSERFEIEVVDTIKHYLPQQDAVLFHSPDPRLIHSGIVGGMSGSPIYLEGRMVGALSYGWRFGKDPLGALTPIGNMLEVGDLPYRPDVLPQPGKRGKKRKGTKAWADSMLGLKTSPLPARRRPAELEASQSLEPLSLPMSIAGLGNESASMLSDALGFTPVRGGAGPGVSAKSKDKLWNWKPGDAVSVVMIRGDSSAASNGTVTWVGPKGKRLLAFGHSMFEDGPSNLPIADARVHTIIASVDRSVKMSSPQTVQGVMYQDRQPAIALRTDLRAPMIPVSTTFQGPDPDLPPRTYNNEVAVGVDLTPNLIAVILAEAADEAGRDATEVVLTMHHEIRLDTTKGPRTLHLEEEVFFERGLIGRILGRSRGVTAIAAALDNQFEVARIREVRHAIKMEYGAPVERIESVRPLGSEFRAGQIVELEVTLRSRDDVERTQIVPLRIPDDAADEQIRIDVSAGDNVRPYRPLAADLDDLLTTIEQGYPSRAMIATIYREGEGLSTKHGLVHDMPDSVMATLTDPGATRDAIRFKRMARRIIRTKTIIEGDHSIKVDVQPPKSFDR